MDMTTTALIASLIINALFIFMLRASGTQREWAEQELAREKKVFEKEKGYIRQDIGELEQMLIRAVRTRNQGTLKAYVRHVLALTKNPNLIEWLQCNCREQEGSMFCSPERTYVSRAFGEVALELRKKQRESQ
ncbi:MAG: hypothetical protein ACEQSB_05485 [Undibacterium sp.]